MKPQMVSEEIAASLEEQSAAALLRVLRATRDVIRLRDDVVSLRSSVSTILQKLKKVIDLRRGLIKVHYPSFKLVIVGDVGTGKTTFVKRHLTIEFEKRYERPRCVLSCAKERRPLPKQGFTCCLAMEGVKVLASGFDTKEKVKIEELVTEMGGTLHTKASLDFNFQFLLHGGRGHFNFDSLKKMDISIWESASENFGQRLGVNSCI